MTWSLAPGSVSHVELYWEAAGVAALLRGVAEHARVLIFDKRGTGLSDRIAGAPTLEERSDDIRAVMDAAGSPRAALFGISEGVPMSVVFAASHPERVSALVLYGGMARTLWAPDYLFGYTEREYRKRDRGGLRGVRDTRWPGRGGAQRLPLRLSGRGPGGSAHVPVWLQPRQPTRRWTG